MAPVKRKCTRRLVAPPPAGFDLGLTTSCVWMPFREAAARAGTLEALLPPLSSELQIGELKCNNLGHSDAPLRDGVDHVHASLDLLHQAAIQRH